MSAIKVIGVTVGMIALSAGSFFAGKFYAEHKAETDASTHLKKVSDILDREYAELVDRVNNADEKVRAKVKDKMDTLKARMAGSRNTLRLITDLRDDIVSIIKDMI